ncbi:Uma2 family endonuclease [Metabacillus herbersteinensis]|uniref:Uma2 family endonuclease n=1 Tax=Metabacillus herbersteinensis TaxID=283816 RepID=A0ABV6GFZ8_9BACI
MWKFYTVKIDRWKKYQLYEAAGVKEYWIVDVTNESIEVYILKNKQYEFVGVFTKEEAISVHILEGFELKLDKVFV